MSFHVVNAQPKPLHPLVQAGRWLALDLLSTFLFLGVYAISHSVAFATVLAIATGIAHVAWLKLRGLTVDAMQWMSLGLVFAFGGGALITHDPRFVMLKPTLIYAAIGATMLKRGWMVRYMPPRAMQWGADVVTAFGYVWAALMFATAAMNLALVAGDDEKTWIWFLGVFPLASKLILFAIQYGVTRKIVVRRIRTAKPEGALPMAYAA